MSHLGGSGRFKMDKEHIVDGWYIVSYPNGEDILQRVEDGRTGDGAGGTGAMGAGSAISGV